ncbi:MAG: DNA adenine methylase [bacterium]|nr:DNA adenine methylase [bacterium]
MKPFLNYIGGKGRMAKRILPYFPEHDCYVEVFGGSGAMLFAKEPSRYEKYNDVDDELVNLFRQVRKNGEEFERNIRLLPQSRTEYEDFRDDNSELNDIERAVRTYYLSKNSFSGGGSSGFSASSKHKGRYYMQQDFEQWSSRLSRITIENLDFRKIIGLYDGPRTFFYIDPPFFDVKNYYRFPFSNNDHVELANLLSKLSGKWLLSYNDNPIVRDMYSAFPMIRLPVWYSIARKSKKETELLIANYPLEGDDE